MYGLSNIDPKKFRKTPSAASNFTKSLSSISILDINDVHFPEFFRLLCKFESKK